MDTYKYRSPWKVYSELYGTDALQYPPNVNKNSKLSSYLDELSRSGYFIYNKNKKYKGINILRFM